jgi:hypothetical protein
MPSIPSLSEFIKCNNLSSCFQELYNFLFALFILLAFLSFLYGAFLYLLSAGGVYDKEKGKNKMKNSIIALLVALIVPIILNMINPGIFRSELKVPQVEVTLPEYQGFGSGYIEPPPGSTQPPPGSTQPPPGSTQPPPGSTQPPSGPGGGNQPTSGTIQNNVILIKQTDPNFRNIPYGCDTIGGSGCGIVSLAMAISYCNGNIRDTNYLRNLITELANYAVKNPPEKPYFICGVGTSHGLFIDNNFLRKYNVEGRTVNIEGAKDALKKGEVVIAGFRGSFPGFGYDNHIVLLTGYKNGKFLVNDPANLNVTEISIQAASGHIVAMTAIRCLSNFITLDFLDKNSIY